MTNVSYFFPCMGLVAPDTDCPITAAQFRLHKVAAAPSTFDFASLGTKHLVSFTWNWLEIFIGDAGAEIEVTNCETLSEAQAQIRILQSMLYLQGVSPFTVPVAVSHSIADYAGLNARDSDLLRAKLPDEATHGFRSEDGAITVDLHEPALTWIGSTTPKAIDQTTFIEAAESVATWLELEASHPHLATARHALLVAPAIYDLGSSLLMCWQGIEALFPAVSTEVKFRVSLLLGQLARPLSTASETYLRAKKSYDARSRVAHGNFSKLKIEDWVEAWNLLLLALQSAQAREGLPSGDDLTLELLTDAEDADPAPHD